MGFTRREYYRGLPCPPPGDLPDSGIKPASPALAGEFFTMGATWKACKHIFSGIKYNYIDVWPSPPSTSRNSSSFPPEILFPLSISLSSSPGPVSMNLTSLGILYKRNHTVSFHDWLISLSIVPSRYSCVIAGARIFFLSKAKYYSTVWMEFFLSILDKCCVYLCYNFLPF